MTPPVPLCVMMLSVALSSLSRQGALIFPRGGLPGAAGGGCRCKSESVLLRVPPALPLPPLLLLPLAKVFIAASVLEDTELSCVRSCCVGGAAVADAAAAAIVVVRRDVPWACSVVSEQMGDVCSHLRFVAE